MRREARWAIKFDLTSVIPTGEKINSATLRVYCCDDFLELGQYHSRYKGRHAAYRISSPWQAGGTETTWDTWNTPGGDYTAQSGDTCWFDTCPVNKWMEYEITEMVQFFVDNPIQNYGVMLRPAMDNPQESHQNLGTDTVYQGYVFVSAEPDDASLQQYKPQVIIEYGTTGTDGLSSHFKHNLLQTIQKGNTLQIQSPVAGWCIITDCLGRIVNKINIDQRNIIKTIPLTLGNGVYIVSIKNKTETYKQKIKIIQ